MRASCPFDRTAVAAMIEHGVRLAGRRNKVTARFSEPRRPDARGLLPGAPAPRKPGDGRASARRAPGQGRAPQPHRNENPRDDRRRHSADRLPDGIAPPVRSTASSVLEIGGYAFGKPVRITASTALGESGIINIERESNLSGRLHDKERLIIAGYLRGLFAQDKPLSLSASICFEQSYSGIEGDSASATEVYALLSSLADLPVRQDMAVTGSVNQRGVIQPIGGVNQKIEGFYDVCRVQGLTGTQGVLIPIANVEDLMLRDDVIEAVAAGRFHVYPVAHIEEGIEILTGVPAGIRDSAGHYDAQSVFGRVDDRLRHMAHTLKQFE